MKLTRIIIATLGIVTALSVVPAASADPIEIVGSGTWDAGTQTTAYSASDATWSFSFFLPDPIASNPTTQVTDFSYYLNGTLVSTTLPGGVLFYPVSEGGGFDLFTDGQSGINVLSLFFPEDIGSDLEITPGTYQTEIGLNDGLTPGEGTGTITAMTPEPSSIFLLGSALLLTGGLVYSRRPTEPVN